MRKEQQTLFEAADDKHVNMRGDPWQRTPYEGTTVWQLGICVGDIVIVEDIRYDFNGKWLPSQYYRCICGEHKTVSGMMKHLTPAPDDEFPLIPPWQCGWIYVGGYANHRYWKRKEANDEVGKNREACR